MGKILLLDGVTIDQIAAGEVVERPASVVKELIENSIDAGAQKIEVILLNGGRQRIQVIDDGEGMEREDALLAIERHATSKIRKFEDLRSSYSLGFRGEALSSIAAVSRMTLQTSTDAGALGSKIQVEGGEVRSKEAVGIPRGTNIIVEDLFFNTPARLRFLRSIPSEVGKVKEIVTSMALGYPEISFRLTHQDMELLHTSGTGEAAQTLEQIFSSSVCKELFSVEGSYGPLHLTGFLGRPNIARGNRGHQFFFLNRRLFSSKMISVSAEKAYDTLLPVARFPFLLLNIELPLDLVDINVHPTKMEVKFRNEKDVFRGVLEIVRSGLRENVIETPWISRYRSNSNSFPVKENITNHSQALPFVAEEKVVAKNDMSNREEVCAKIKPLPLKNDFEQDVPSSNVVSEKGFFRGDTPVLSLFDTYLLWEDSSDLILIDQHAAHERVIYDQLLSNQSKNMQYFLTPITVELSEEQFITAKEKGTILQELGWEFEEFGGCSVLLRSGPQALSVEDVQELFISLINELGLCGVNHESNPKERMLKIMACRQAVKAGNRLSAAEATTLIKNLRESRIPQTCPHGRPTMVAISKAEIEKMFKRR